MEKNLPSWEEIYRNMQQELEIKYTEEAMEKNLKYEIAKEIVDVVEKNVLKTIDEIIQNKYKKFEEIRARKDVEEILQLMEMDEMAIRKLHETFYEINDYYCDAINEEGGDM